MTKIVVTSTGMKYIPAEKKFQVEISEMRSVLLQVGCHSILILE